MALKKGRDQAGLRDHEAALRAALADLPPVMVAAGECEYLRAHAVERLRAAWLERCPDGDVAILRGSGEAKPLSLADITRELSGGSLFAKDKLVVVRQAERALFPVSRAGDEAEAPTGKAGEREKAFVDRLEKPAPRLWLILETAQLQRNRVLGKRLAEFGTVIPCPQPTQRDIPEWLFGQAASLGARLDDAAADLLLRAHGTDLGVLAAELDKLALFAGEGTHIDADMVGQFLTGTIEFDVFSLTNAVEAHNARQAAYYARRVTMQGARDQKGKKEDGDRAAHRILFMVAGSVMTLLRARIAMAAGLSSGEFASTEKISPWRADKVYDACRAYELPQLRRMAAHAADQLRRAHDTGGDAALSLETTVIRFTNSLV